MLKKFVTSLTAVMLSMTMCLPGISVSAYAKAKKTKVYITPKTATIQVGKTKKLKIKGTKKKAVWSISGKAVTFTKKSSLTATIKGKKSGASTVTARISKKKYSVRIKVKKKSGTAVYTPKKKTLAVGQSFAFRTAKKISSYKFSKSGIASAKISGKTLKVTAKETGKTTLTVETGGKKRIAYRCVITVKEKETSVKKENNNTSKSKKSSKTEEKKGELYFGDESVELSKPETIKYDLPGVPTVYRVSYEDDENLDIAPKGYNGSSNPSKNLGDGSGLEVSYRTPSGDDFVYSSKGISCTSSDPETIEIRGSSKNAANDESQLFYLIPKKDGDAVISVSYPGGVYKWTVKSEGSYAYNKVKDIMTEIRDSGLSDAQKVLLTAYYERRGLLKYKVSNYHYSLDETLHNVKINCGGYASVFQYLTDFLNIKSEKVPMSDHVYNQVQINGNWYNIDTSGTGDRSTTVCGCFFIRTNEMYTSIPQNARAVDSSLYNINENMSFLENNSIAQKIAALPDPVSDNS